MFFSVVMSYILESRTCLDIYFSDDSFSTSLLQILTTSSVKGNCKFRNSRKPVYFAIILSLCISSQHSSLALLKWRRREWLRVSAVS